MKAFTTSFPKKHVSQNERRKYQPKKTNLKSKNKKTKKRDSPYKKISEILPLHSGIIVVLSNK